jgi:hypothetical protein
MCQIAPDRVINKDFMEQIEQASQGLPVNRLLEKVEAVRAAQTSITQNANPRLTLEVMMMRLCLDEARAGR